MKYIYIFLISILGLGQSNAQAYLDDIMLQSFGWDEQLQARNVNEGGLYNYYASRADVLKQMGFDMIWFPPPSHSTGGVGYIPTEYFKFDQTSWGTEAELDAMLAELGAVGIEPIADLVVNHRAGTTGWMDFTNPTWGCDAVVSNDEAAGSGAPAGTTIPCGAPDTGDDIPYARDLDHSGLTVRNGVKQFLQILKAKGFTGWRWDVAKGFAPQYFGEYNADSQPYLSIGEFFDGNVNAVKGWVDGSGNTVSGTTDKSAAFDFPLYYILSDAVKNNNWGVLNDGGSMPGLAGEFGYADKSVTFVDNHDTFVHGSAFLGTEILRAYAYTLTHPGVPSVFASHLFGGTYTKDGVTRVYSNYEIPIRRMMSIRKQNNIDAFSHITIDQSSGFYAAYIRQRSTDAEPVIAVKIGPGSWSPAGTGWQINTSGADYAIWSKIDVNNPPRIVMNPAQTTHTSGSTVNVSVAGIDFDGDNRTVYYTTDGTTPTTASTVYSGPIVITTDTTVKAICVDEHGASSGVISKDYRFLTPKDVTVYFKPPSGMAGWIPPKIHYWDAQPAGVIADADWTTPLVMQAETGLSEPGWYSYTFNNITSVNVLFRSASPTAASAGVTGDNKTGDLMAITDDIWYEWDPSEASFVSEAVSLSTTEIELDRFKVEVTPNPTKGTFKLNTDAKQVQVYNMLGKLVKEFSTVAKGQALNAQHIPTGVYMLKVLGEDGKTYTSKLIKE